MPLLDTAVIIAAGSKAHTSQLTYNRPRTMLPALGKPLCVRVMDRFYRAGIEKYTVILGEEDGAVANYLNTRWLPDVDIEFVLKTESQALARVLASIAGKHGKPMLIASYNSFTHENFHARLIKYHNQSPDDLILTGAINNLSISDTQTYAQITPKNTDETPQPGKQRVTAEMIASINTDAATERHDHSLVNMAACGNAFIKFLQQLSPADARCNTLMDLVASYVAEGHPARLARSGWVLQVQEDADLIALNRHLLDEKIDAHILSEVPYTVKINEPVRIDPGVSVGQGAVIGPHVYLESGSSIGREAHLENTIVLGRASVRGHDTVQNAIISTRGRIQL